MKVELTEEEREFLERICLRAKFFAEMNIEATHPDDLPKVNNLIQKLKKC